MKAKHQFRITDASQDRQPEIQLSVVREDFQRIVVQTNNVCIFQILILPKSTTSSAPYPQELNPWSSGTEEPLHSSTVEKSERTNTRSRSEMPIWAVSKKKKTVIFSGGDSSKNYGADQQRLQISNLKFDKFPTPATFACWKMRFKTEVCICSQFPTEAMLWIKEAEMVESVDDLMSSSSNKRNSNAEF